MLLSIVLSTKPCNVILSLILKTAPRGLFLFPILCTFLPLLVLRPEVERHYHRENRQKLFSADTPHHCQIRKNHRKHNRYDGFHCKQILNCDHFLSIPPCTPIPLALQSFFFAYVLPPAALHVLRLYRTISSSRRYLIPYRTHDAYYQPQRLHRGQKRLIPCLQS